MYRIGNNFTEIPTGQYLTAKDVYHPVSLFNLCIRQRYYLGIKQIKLVSLPEKEFDQVLQ